MPNYSGIWSLSQQFQGRGQGLWPAVPGAPTIGTARSINIGVASVAFTAPACSGVPATITGYIAKSTPGCITATGSSSPITVSGLCSSTSYTFAVAAQNASGYGAYSAQSNSVTPNIVAGQQAYTTPGTYTWVAPTGVTRVSFVVVGGGAGSSTTFCVCLCPNYRTYGSGGGGGGALAYRNCVSVSPGSGYTVVVGTGGAWTLSGGASSVTISGVNTTAGGGSVSSTPSGGAGGTPSGTFANAFSGGAGGNGGTPLNSLAGGGGGGGAAGYGGNGASGGGMNSAGSSNTGTNVGAGGGGGGGRNCCSSNRGGGAGGGVGILGVGANGAGGTFPAGGGGGGSGGAAGSSGSGRSGGSGGAYGGGAGGNGYAGCSVQPAGGGGAVRIIWPGNTRQFPSTCTGDV